MFNEPYAEIPSGALGTWGCPGSPGGRVHLSPSPSICLTDSFVSLCLPLFGPGCLPAWTPVTALWVDGFVCLPAWMSGTALWADGFICLPLSPSCCPPAWMPGTAPWSFAVYSAGTHVCLRLRNVCLSARARALDQATGSMLRMHVRVLQVNDCVFLVCFS